MKPRHSANPRQRLKRPPPSTSPEMKDKSSSPWEGGVFPQATPFDIRSEAMHAMLSNSKLSVMHFRSENDWLSQDGQGLLRQFVFTLDLPPEPGTYDTTQYAMTFGVSSNPEGRGLKSIRTRDEVGTLTIISRTEDHVTGSFDVRGRATQMHSTDPVYRIHGTFTFGRGR